MRPAALRDGKKQCGSIDQPAEVIDWIRKILGEVENESWQFALSISTTYRYSQ
jgi:hypothetical protein